MKFILTSKRFSVLITSNEGGGKCICPHSFVCLSVCLLARFLKKTCMDLDEMLVVDRCQDMDELFKILSPIRIIVRMSKLDCFLRYRMRCNAEFYYVRKIARTGIGRPLLQRHMVLKRFYSPLAVGSTLSEVHALHRVPF